MTKEAKRDEAHVNLQAKRLAFKAFSHSSSTRLLAPTGAADTLYILGSGESVESLTPKNFDEIASQKSIGINYWSAHHFVPDVYSFEITPRVGDGGDFFRATRLLNRDEVLHRKPKLLILRPGAAHSSSLNHEIPLPLRANTFVYGRITPSTRQKSNLLADLEYFFSKIAPSFPGITLDSGASVVRMVTIGILLGFRRIVLVGVDLNGSRYFWEANPTYLTSLHGNSPVNNQRGTTHETMSRLGRPFTVAEILVSLNQFLQSNLGGEILVASPDSILASFLPQVSWRKS